MTSEIAEAQGQTGDGTGASVTVMTWNVQNANPARAVRQAACIAASPADAAVLTEVPRSDGGQNLARALHRHGFTTHVTDAAGDYSVMITARAGDLRIAEHLRSPHLSHRFIAATLTLPVTRPDETARGTPTRQPAGVMGAVQIGLVGMYVPSRGPRQRRNVDKRAFQAAVTDLLPELTAGFDQSIPLVVAGDLNVIEPGHVPAHTNFGAWEYDFYRTFADAGLTDAYRHLHPDDVEHSWYGRRSGAGYRFDHLFCSRPHLPALRECRYDHEPRHQGLSDHAALIAVLAPTSTTTGPAAAASLAVSTR